MSIKIRSSRNPDVMDKNIQRLADGLNDLDTEIPEHTSSDAGKYLGVDSSGDLEFSNPLPAYSSTGEVNTGQKWIDGKDIYRITRSFLADDTATSPVTKSISLNADIIISIIGTMINVTDQNLIIPLGVAYDNNTRSVMRYATTSKQIQITNYFSGTYGGNFVTVYYTKPDPEPGPENDTRDNEEPVTKSVRKKTTK